MQTKVKPVILLISANPVKDLPHVEEEIKDITKVIRGKYPQPQEQIRVESIFNTNLEYLYQTIRFNRENIVIVHFAGHATNNALILNDGEYNSSFLSEELNRMPNLQLTFLNGCGTSSFVDKLNINNIIATKAEIPDYPAAQIASHFIRGVS
jgi:CHAT domain-containing protein